MKELRKIEKAIKEYEILISNDQKTARENCEYYIKDIESLNSFIESYLDTTVQNFQVWCDTSVSVFEEETNNVFGKIKKQIDRVITNHYLNKLSLEMSKAGILQKRLSKIKLRFIQYQLLT